MLNILGVVFLVLLAVILTLSFVTQNYVYNGILQVMDSSSQELLNIFSGYRSADPEDFVTSAREYVENFSNKQNMELMVINTAGEIVVTSTGFSPDNTQPKPDYDAAMQDADGYGTWTGRLSTGEKVMAVTQLMRDADGNPVYRVAHRCGYAYYHDRPGAGFAGGICDADYLAVKPLFYPLDPLPGQADQRDRQKDCAWRF